MRRGYRRFGVGSILFGLLICAVHAAHGQDPLTTLPNNYWRVFENSAVAVIHAHYGPHEKIPMHDHPGVSTVFVYLSNSGQVRIDHVGEAPVIRPPTVTGSFRVVAGMAERHSIENLGDASSDFLRVELKQIALDLKEPFRGKAPESPLQSGDAIEFTTAGLQIERIVCAGTPACLVKASPAGSLLIAFTPTEVSTEVGSGRERIAAGGVRWLPAMQQVSIAGEGAAPAHVLRILLPANQK